MSTKNHRVIKAQFKGATNNSGARISLTEQRFEKTDKKVISFDYGEDNTINNACKYLESLGINVVGYGMLGDAYYIFSDSWAYDKGFKNIKGDLE